MPLRPTPVIRASPYWPVITHSTLRRLLPGFFTVSSWSTAWQWSP